MPTHYRAFLEIAHNAAPEAMIMQETVVIKGAGLTVASDFENEIASKPAVGPTAYPVPINASCVPPALSSP